MTKQDNALAGSPQRQCTSTIFGLLALCLLGMGFASPTWATAPAALVQQIKAQRKQTTLVASYIKLTLQLGHLYHQHKQYAKALAVYRALVKKYNTPKVRCVAHHFAAQALLSLQKQSEALALYRQLIQQFKGCACRYLPNAHIAMGRAAFDQKQYANALRMYRKAPRCRDNRIAAIAAAYMIGWCTYKLGRYPQALRALLQTLRQLRKQQKAFKGAQRRKLQEVQREALPNLVRAFNRAGKPQQASRTFRQVASPAQVETMLKQLSDSYHTTKNYHHLRLLYLHMARDHRRSPRQVRDWLEVLRASYRLKDTASQLRALFSLQSVTRKYQGQTGDPTLAKDLADVQDQLHRFAMGTHRQAQKSNDNKLYLLSEKFFAAYRALFPKAKDAHKKAYWHGEALLTLERFANAADAYTASAQDPRGFKHKQDAAYKAVLARHRLLNNKQPLPYTKPSPQPTAKSRPIPKAFALFLAAASSFAKAYPTAKKVPYVRYNQGLVYQKFGHWGKARKAFVDVVTNHSNTRYARPAAYHVVDTLRIRQQWQRLHKWTSTFAKIPSFGSRLFKQQMLQIGRAAQMKVCFAQDTAKEYLKAGRCYQAMAQTLGRHKDTPVLLYNAYVAFHNGQQKQQAQAMKQALLQQYPNSRPARMLKR